jgi:hypothetical protein
VRVRSLAKVMLLCALFLCAIQSSSSRALDPMYSYTANGIQLDFVNTIVKPATYAHSISSETLLQVGQFVANDLPLLSKLTSIPV